MRENLPRLLSAPHGVDLRHGLRDTDFLFSLRCEVSYGEIRPADARLDLGPSQSLRRHRDSYGALRSRGARNGLTILIKSRRVDDDDGIHETAEGGGRAQVE